METDIRKITALVRALELGSLTKAAERMGYTQSGISRMISELEKDWGIQLVERGRGGVFLTSAGQGLLASMQALLREADVLKEQVEAVQNLGTGLIRVGSFSSVATHWLPNIIRAFQRDYPKVDYEILLGDYLELEEWLNTGRIDCGFIRLPSRPDFESIFLERDDLVAVLPESHPLAAAETVSAELLCREPFLLQEKGENAEIGRFLHQNGLRPNVRCTTWDDYAIMSMVESGMGVSILPRLILRRCPYAIAVRPLDLPAYRDIGLILRDRRNTAAAVSRFLDYLHFRTGTGEGQ